MNEEFEYAEMLEIPVSTVNTVRKKARPLKWNFFRRKKDKDLQGELIERINDKMEKEEEITVGAELFAESVNSQGTLTLGEIPERIDTVRLYSPSEKRFTMDTEESEEKPVVREEDDGNGGSRYETNRDKRVKLILGIEFATACALCGVIFLTNVFMPDSGINTFFRSLGEKEGEAVARAYTEFTLSPVVSEFSDTELTLSKTGILSFKDETSVYPVCDGTVRSINANPDGSYLITVDYSTSFSGVFDGLDSVYASVGEEVKANIPVGYSKGEKEVQVTMYSNGELLSCLQLTEENCLVWSAQE